MPSSYRLDRSGRGKIVREWIKPLVWVGCLLLGGCATVQTHWAPFPSDSELTTFSARWSAAAKGASELESLKSELVKYREEIYQAALNKSKLEWESSGMTTYGGLAAVVGGLASKIGLINTGAGIAAFGLTNSSLYRFQQQTQIYLIALKRIACITGKVNAVSDTLLSQAKSSSDPAAIEAANHFSMTTVTAVDYVRAEYTNALLGLTPTIPSREELLALMGTYRATAPAKAAGAPDPNQAAYDRAGEAVLGLAVGVQDCSKL